MHQGAQVKRLHRSKILPCAGAPSRVFYLRSLAYAPAWTGCRPGSARQTWKRGCVL